MKHLKEFKIYEGLFDSIPSGDINVFERDITVDDFKDAFLKLFSDTSLKRFGKFKFEVFNIKNDLVFLIVTSDSFFINYVYAVVYDHAEQIAHSIGIMVDTRTTSMSNYYEYAEKILKVVKCAVKNGFEDCEYLGIDPNYNTYNDSIIESERVSTFTELVNVYRFFEEYRTFLVI